MNRLYRWLSLGLIIIMLVQIAPLSNATKFSCEAYTYENTKNIGDIKIALVSNKLAISNRLVSIGGGLQANAINQSKKRIDFNRLYAPALLWNLTNDNKLYSESDNAFMAVYENNLLLTRDNKLALTVDIQKDGRILFYSDSTPINIEFDALHKCFTVADKPINFTTPIYAYFKPVDAVLNTLEETTAPTADDNTPEPTETPIQTPIETPTLTPEPAETPVPTIPVSGVALSHSQITIIAGEKFTLNAIIAPEDASDKTVTWSSGDTNICTVVNGEITAITRGDTNIVVTTNDGGFSATCLVSVRYKTFTVRFLDKFNNVYSQQQVEKGFGATPPKSPTHNGYSFVKWVEDYSNITSDLDVHSSWNLVTYSIFYETNGGTLPPSYPTTYTIETETFALPIPTRVGYNFFGWTDNELPITQIVKGSFGDKSLFAYWNTVVYTINYNLNGGEFQLIPHTSYTIESETFTLLVPTKNGYTFGGWYTNAEFSGGTVIKIEKGTTGNKEFFAKWNKINYSITYNLNGGEFLSTPISTYSIESETFSLPIPTRVGYTFKGWYDNAQLTGNAIESIIKGSTGNKVFYASWQAINYQINYITNGGTLPLGTLTSYNIESPIIYLPLPTKLGYTFMGWYDNANLLGDKVLSIPTGSTGNKHFYARWEYVQYLITYNLNGGKNPIDAPNGYNIDSNFALPTPTKNGYAFSGWYRNANFTGEIVTAINKGATGDIVLFAKWTVVTYSIQYDLRGGVNPVNAPKNYTIESADIVLPTPARNGYDFSGWYNNPQLTGDKVTKIVSGSYGDKVFYASWTAKTYKITYVTNGGIQSPNFINSYTIETPTFTLPTTSKRGYIFLGWYRNADFSGNAVSEIVLGSTGDITLYAKWVAEVYTISYVLNNGINPSDAPKTYTIESGDVTLPLPARVGYDFSGWYNTADFSGEPVSAIAANAVGNRTFYAKWTAKIYTITYITNGGMLPTNTPTSYTIESPTIILPIPTRNAYMFLNWRFMNETGTIFDKIISGSVGNYTFYATWTPTVYNIKYNVYDGTMPNEYATTYTIESDTITLPRPTMVGHVFVGWYDNKELSGVPIREIAKGSYGNLEFFASWRRLIYTVKFVDWDYETELGSVNVEHGAAITNPPTAPTHYGYDFTGWDKDITCVTQSMTVAAVYELTSYSVVFVDIDYYVLSSQQVKHGQSAIAPTPPQREGSVFAFWSCDFSNVTSDLTVIAVYRTTTVTPTQQPLRFVQADSLNAGEHYIFAVKNFEGEQFALSVLDRLSGNGLWGIEIKVDRRGIMPQSETNNLDEVIFIANTGNEGYRLANIMSGEYLTASDGYVQMKNMFPLYADSFGLQIIDGKGYLYNAKRDVYLSYDNDGYFKTSNIESACEIIVYKHIKISADYTKVTNPELGKNYYIVAQKNGVSYALSYKNGAISTIPVDVIDNKLYFYDNINEWVPAFRFMYGDNQKGFNVRCVADSGFLGVVNNSYITTSDMLLAGFFVYQQFEDTENYVFLDYLSNTYLYCDDFGNVSADSEFSNVLLFERVPKDGRMGDVNMDASVNTGDATLMLRHIVGKITLNETQLKLFDTNVDRHRNTGDVTHLLRFVVGEIDWIGE